MSKVDIKLSNIIKSTPELRKLRTKFKSKTKFKLVKDERYGMTARYCVLESLEHYSLESWVEKYDHVDDFDFWLGACFLDKDYWNIAKDWLKERGIKSYSSGDGVPKKYERIYHDDAGDDYYYIGYYKSIHSTPQEEFLKILNNFEKLVAYLRKMNILFLEKKEELGMDIIRNLKTRKGHEKFAKRVRSQWKNKCALTGIDVKELLVASHIDPWANNEHERLNPLNGILLSANMDKLFDRHLISFDRNGKILISDVLDGNQRKLIGVDNSAEIKLPNGMNKFMDEHRKLFLEKQSTANQQTAP